MYNTHPWLSRQFYDKRCVLYSKFYGICFYRWLMLQYRINEFLLPVLQWYCFHVSWTHFYLIYYLLFCSNSSFCIQAETTGKHCWLVIFVLCSLCRPVNYLTPTVGCFIAVPAHMATVSVKGLNCCHSQDIAATCVLKMPLNPNQPTNQSQSRVCISWYRKLCHCM